MSDVRDFKNKNTKFTGTDSVVLPKGTTAERNGTPELGMLRYNTQLGFMEQYNATGWAGIDAPPVVTNQTGTVFSTTDSTITVDGSNFKSGSTVYVTGAGVSNVERALATTFVSSSQLTAATNASSVNYVAGANYGIKVVNPSGLSAVLDPAGSVDSPPAWNTGTNLGSVVDNQAISTITVSATDPDGTSVTYSLAGGSLGGLSLNSSNGQITGTPNSVTGSTTLNPVIRATSNGATADRTFSLTVTPRADGSDANHAAHSAKEILDAGYSSGTGLYWLTIPGNSPAQVYCDMSLQSGGWTAVYKTHHASAHTFRWPSDNTFAGTSSINPRDSGQANTEFNLPNKVTQFGPSSGSDATEFMIESYDYGSGNADFIYKYTFDATTKTAWEAGNSYQQNFIRYTLTATNVEDRCVSNNGTRVTTDSISGRGDGTYWHDKASPNPPGTDGNWDVANPVGNNRKDANCDRYGGGGPGLYRSSCTILWVR